MPERVSAETKQRILETAAAMLNEGPMQTLQIQEIADRAEVSPSAIYKAYSNKYELFAYAAESVIVDQVRQIAARIDESDPPIDILRSILADYYTLATAHPHAATYIFAAMPLIHHNDIEDKQLLQRIAGLTQRARDMLARRITAAAEAGELQGDPELLTEQCLILTFGYVALTQTGATTIPPDEFAAMVVTSLSAVAAPS